MTSLDQGHMAPIQAASETGKNLKQSLRNKMKNKAIAAISALFLILVASPLLCARVEPPTAEFVANKTQVAVGEFIQFMDWSRGDINSWFWDFGDGNISTKQNPIHSYAAPGNYTVSLTVSNPISSSTMTKVVLC
jgi:PKD repeat protein